MTGLPLDYDRELLAEICRRFHVRRLSLFGSVTRPAFRASSDVDVLVEFEPGRTPGFSFFRLQQELADLFGRAVDLNTPGFLSRYFRGDVVKSAEVLYARE